MNDHRQKSVKQAPGPEAHISPGQWFLYLFLCTSSTVFLISPNLTNRPQYKLLWAKDKQNKCTGCHRRRTGWSPSASLNTIVSSRSCFLICIQLSSARGHLYTAPHQPTLAQHSLRRHIETIVGFIFSKLCFLLLDSHWFILFTFLPLGFLFVFMFFSFLFPFLSFAFLILRQQFVSSKSICLIDLPVATMIIVFQRFCSTCS